MEKENFIKEILNSTNGIQQVTPNDALFYKIQARLDDEKPVDGYTKWLVAASIAILISLNIGVFSSSSKKTENDTNLSELVTTTNNQLY